MSPERQDVGVCYTNITQLVTLDEDYLTERAGRISPKLMAHVDAGLKLVLDL